MTAHTQTLGRYAGAFVDALVAAGLEDVCLCPGSRSTPLALTFARHPAIKIWTHLDERSCAYFALGMAKARGGASPIAVLCSSGTAAVNFAPAVVEAYHARVPLLVLTADRPPELHGVGANQTIDQRELYGPAAKWFVDMPLPEASDEMLRYVRLVAAGAIERMQASPAGPVHLNFPFRERLMPDRVAPASLPRSESMAIARREPDVADVASLADELVRAERGLIVCGPQDDAELPASVGRLARRLGFPLLADPLSNVRSGVHYDDQVVGAYDAFLRDAGLSRRLAPDLVLRFGDAPISKALAAYLVTHRSARQVLVSDDSVVRDPDLTADRIVRSDAAALCRTLLAALPEAPRPTDGWLATWQNAERASVRAVAAELAGQERVSEPGAVRALSDLLPEGAIVYAGNSMPVRDIDAVFPAGARDVRFLGNRGASGIDGVISSALGAAAATKRRVVLVIGDLSFYHDMNGLLAARRHALDATIVLINNDGGGIFSFLEQANDPQDFEALFGTPHGLDFQPVAALYGVEFTSVTSMLDYRAAVEASFGRSGVGVIEVKTDRRENVDTHRRLWQAVSAAVASPGEGRTSP